MPIAVRCRLCGRPYNLAGHLAGRVVQCKECQAAIHVPAAAEHSGGAAAPQYGGPPPLGPVLASPPPVAPVFAEPPAGSPLLAPRRKRNNNQGPLILAVVGATALGLVAFVAIGFLAVGTLVPRLMSFAASSPAPTPQPLPVTFTGSSQAQPSNARQFEELLQKFLAALQGFNNVLAQVVDGDSARRQRDQALARYNELMALFPQITAFVPHITPEEDRRLESIYGAQLTMAVEQLKLHVTRIRQIQHAELAFGGRLPFDDLHSRMGSLHGPGLRIGSNTPGASFQPPAPPAFRPPQSPLTGSRPSIPRSSLPRPSAPRPPMAGPRAPIGPRQPPFSHGVRGPGAMHGRRGR
jgi:hypothetical protein